MKTTAVIATLALTLLVPAASAKAPPDGFRICGSAACAPVAGDDAEQLAIRMFYSGAATRWSAPAPSEPFYVLHWRWSVGQPEQTAYYVAGAHALRFAPETSGTLANPFGWTILDGTSRSIIARLASSLEPIAGADVTSATVGGQRVRDPAGYAVLWSAGTARTFWPATGWVRVRITTSVASPWSGTVYVARDGPYLMRDETVFRIPRVVAARVRARAPLR